MSGDKKRMRADQRRTEERVPAALGVSVEGGRGVTRDVSASGLYFEIEGSFKAGSPIDLAIDLELPSGPMLLCCHGSIVRVEERDGRAGVAVRITESVLKAEQAARAVNLTPLYHSHVGKRTNVK